MKKDSKTKHSVSRRKFVIASGVSMLAASNAIGMTGPRFETEAADAAAKIPLGFDNFSIRAHQWKADRLIEFAAEQQLDSVLLSDLDVYENHEVSYLETLKKKAGDLGIVVHAGTGSICPTADRFTDKYGSAEELLRLGIKVAKSIGSPVFRCYLGGAKDRLTDGGIQKHIDTTVDILKKVKTFAIDSNVKIAVENHAGDMQAWELVGLIEAAGSDFVGATIDSGNATWTLENPLGNLEVLGRFAVSSGIRDSTVWEYDKGVRVAWNAIGEGQVDWKAYAAKYAELCPGVPFQLEIISGFNKSFECNEAGFWDAYPNAKARDYQRFLDLAKTGKEVPAGKANDPEYQMNELLRSIQYCKTELALGTRA